MSKYAFGCTAIFSIIIAAGFASETKHRGFEIASLKSELAQQAAWLKEFKEENIRYYNVALDLGIDLDDVLFSTPVTITAYSARKEECNNDPHVTASGRPSRVGMLAISRDLRDELGIHFGQTVWLKGLGQFKVCDLMNARFKRRVDILHATAEAAKKFGSREGTIMWFGKD